MPRAASTHLSAVRSTASDPRLEGRAGPEPDCFPSLDPDRSTRAGIEAHAILGFPHRKFAKRRKRETTRCLQLPHEGPITAAALRLAATPVQSRDSWTTAIKNALLILTLQNSSALAYPG